MGFYQVSSYNSPVVKFDPSPGVTSFTWDYIGKTLEFSAMRPRVTKFCMWASTKSAQTIALGVEFGPALGVTSFTLAYIGKT